MNNHSNNINNPINNADVINNHNIAFNNGDMQNMFINCSNNMINYIDRELMREYLLTEMNYYLWSTAPGIHNDAYGNFLLDQLDAFENINFSVEVKNMLNNILNYFQLLNLEQKKLMYNYISSLFRNY
jgi:hypothetical protein